MTPLADEDQTRVRLVGNKRTKLSTTDMNGLAIAVVVVGGFSPVLSGSLDGVDALHLALFGGRMLVCLAASGLLHFSAYSLLKDLQ